VVVEVAHFLETMNELGRGGQHAGVPFSPVRRTRVFAAAKSPSHAVTAFDLKSSRLEGEAEDVDVMGGGVGSATDEAVRDDQSGDVPEPVHWGVD
jgi:hypothetical protein